MPNNTYVICQNTDPYPARPEWIISATPVDAIEIGMLFVYWVKHYWSKSTLLALLSKWEEKEYVAEGISEEEPELLEAYSQILQGIRRAKSTTKSITLTVSRTALDELDAFFSDKSIPAHIRAMKEISQVVDIWSDDRAIGVGIHFSEVFLVEHQQDLPAHYRPDTDWVVNNVAEYRLQTSKFSYQLAKKFLTLWHPFCTTTAVSAYIYSGWEWMYRPNHFIQNELTSIVEIIRYVKKHSIDRQIVLRISPHVDLMDLKHARNAFLDCTQLCEVVFLLPGSHYADGEQRAQVLETMLALATQSNWQFLPQVFLLTQPVEVALVNELIPEAGEQGGYRALENAVGYYLTDPRLFGAVYRNAQTRAKEMRRKFQDVFVQTSERSPKQMAYIIQTEPTAHYRKSKEFNAMQLKSQLNFTVTQQYALAQEVSQTQTLQQQQNLNQQQELTQTQQRQSDKHLAFDMFRTTVTFEQFCSMLYDHAAYIDNPQYQHEDTQLCRRHNYFTDYREQTNLYKKLLDKNFCTKVTATIFGRFPYSSGPLGFGLQKHSFMQMDYKVAWHLVRSIEHVVDGLDSDSWTLESGFYYLVIPMYRCATLIGYSSTFSGVEESKRMLNMSVLSLGYSDRFQAEIQTTCILREEDLCALRLTPTAQAGLVQALTALVALFKSSQANDLTEESRFRRYLLVAFRTHCSQEDIDVFNRFLHTFPTLSRDHCKIFLYLIVTGYRDHVVSFITLLKELEKRALWDNFRRIYFDYAQNIASVSHLLQEKFIQFYKKTVKMSTSLIYEGGIERYGYTERHPTLFLQVAQNTPIGFDTHAWPPFEKFAHHFLLYTSKQNIDVRTINLKALQKFWQRIDAQIYRYHQEDRNATEETMRFFVDNLICPIEGLVIAPVCQAMTILDGITEMIELAIRHDMLHEQLTEWQDISLLRTDAPYAGAEDGFGVISKEMAIEISKLKLFSEQGDTTRLRDAYRSSYVFTHQELALLLDDYCIVSTGVYKTFTTRVFRYLGCQTLREPIDFYRQLLQFNLNETDPVDVYFRHMLWAYFIFTKTGEQYTQAYSESELHDDFVSYLLKKNYVPPNNEYEYEKFAERQKHDPTQIMQAKIAGEYQPLIAKCVHDFWSHLKTIQVLKKPEDRYNLWQFYKKYHKVDNTMFGKGLVWAGLSAELSFATIPAIFKRKFSIGHLAKFFLVNQEALKESASIFNQHPKILIALLMEKIQTSYIEIRSRAPSFIAAHEVKKRRQIILTWLNRAFPNLTLEKFIANLIDLEKLIVSFNTWALNEDAGVLSQAVSQLLHQHLDIKSVLTLFHLITEQQALEQYQPKLLQDFLDALTTVPRLVGCATHAQALLSMLCTAHMTYAKDEWRLSWVFIGQTLSELEPKMAIESLKTLLSVCPWDDETPPFFLNQSFSAEQLQGLAQVLASKPVSFTLLEIIWRENPQTDFSELAGLLHAFTADQCTALSQLALHVHDTDQSMLSIIQQCSTHPKASLSLLARLTELYKIDAQQVRTLLYSADFKRDMMRLEQSLYTKNLERFDYDLQDVVDKISQIRKKSMLEGEADRPLSREEQAKLLADFQHMMSYMRENPVLIEVNEHGEKQTLTIHQLDEAQFKFVYQLLSKKLQDPTVSAEKKHAYRLSLLALTCDAQYRPTKKFPRMTQILCDLHGLDDPNSMIQQVRTGGGKSIISELRAVLLAAEGWTVEIATENLPLAKEAWHKFKLYYDYLGILGHGIILPDSPRSAYVDGGIYHATPANFSFFHANMALKKKTLPKKVALLCDEIDAALTTTIQYRLAGVLDLMYSDLKSWRMIWKSLLSFAREKELFLNNKCDESDDVHNFRMYFIRQHSEKKLHDFMEKIPEEVLNMLLNSARMPEVLQKSVDYLAILRQKQKKKEQYAAPVLNVGTKRPEASVSYAEGVQQLVHTAENAILEEGELEFDIEAMTETIMVIAAKNFFDFYSLIIGWTGTPGAQNELREFFEQHGLQAYYYPTFYPDTCENLGTIIVETREEQFALLLQRAAQRRALNPGQPLAMSFDSPKLVNEFKTYVQTHASDLAFNTYEGYEHEGLSEEKIVEKMGQENALLLHTLCVMRGTDPETDYPQGICLTNTATDITECDYIQGKGRPARNGKPGQYGDILCALDLDPSTADITDPNERFKAHRQKISLKRQKERLKTRFLEVMRYHVVSQYFIKLRQEADQILTGQYGLFSTAMPEKKFLETLRDFNKHSEKEYMRLLGEQDELQTQQKLEFLHYLVDLYQNALTQLIPDQDLQNFQAIEPLIPLQTLETASLAEDIKLQDLLYMSDILSSGWRALGNRTMVEGWTFCDQIVDEFQPYFDGECSLRVATAEILLKREVLKIPKVVIEIEHFKSVIEAFDWDTVISNAQLAIDESSDNMVVQGFSRMIKHILRAEIIQKFKIFVLKYLDDTKQQIAEKRWDDLSLPKLDEPWIKEWVDSITVWSNRLKNLARTFSWITWGSAFIAGPIPFIVSRFVLPTILSWLKTMVKRWFAGSESTMIQVLIGLDDAFGDIQKLFDVLFNKDLKTLTVDALLKEIAPIFKNKAMQLIASKLFETEETSAGFFQLLPNILAALEPYRALLVSDLKRPEIIMTIFIKILQSDVIKSMMEPELHGQMLERIQTLPEGFGELFKDCSLPELLNIVKILAHPRFNEFLKQLPPEAEFKDLITWLQAEAEEVPELVKLPMQNLRNYQENHERIAQESQLAFRNLKTKYQLQCENLQAYGAISKHKLPEVIPLESSVSWWMAILNLQLTQWILTYAALLVANYLFFSFSFVWVTTAFLALFVVPTVSQMLKTQANTAVDAFPDDIITPFAVVKSLALDSTVVRTEQAKSAPLEKPSATIWSTLFGMGSKHIGVAIPDSSLRSVFFNLY